MIDIQRLVAFAAGLLARKRENNLYLRIAARLSVERLSRSAGAWETKMTRKFTVQRAGSDGWVFASSRSDTVDIFLFGPNPKDVERQMEDAENVLRKMSATRSAVREAPRPEWKELACA